MFAKLAGKIALCAMAIALVSATASAQAGRANRQNRQNRQDRQRLVQVSVAQIPIELLEKPCQLTPEQISKIRSIQSKLQEDLRGLRPQRGAAQDPSVAQKRRDITQQAVTEINNVLTPEQRAKVREAAPELGMLRSLGVPLQVLGDLKLTDEQKQKILQIAKDIVEKVRELPNEERRAKMRELLAEARPKVQALFTDEQKAVLQKARAGNRQRERGNPPSP